MAAYGSESLQSVQDGRYRLSFTVGGLLADQGQTVAALLVETLLHVDGNAEKQSPIDDATELGKQAAMVRQQAIDENVLHVRTRSANVRTVREVLKRLSALTWQELRHLANCDSPLPDRQALMWVAMCRYYAVVGEFANEVLHEHFLVGAPTLTYDDYDRFMLGKALWHPEIEELSISTVAKLRANVFKALFEANLLNKANNAIVPSLLSGELAGILMNRADSFGYFPMRATNRA